MLRYPPLELTRQPRLQMCRDDQVTREAGCVGLDGKGLGEEGILSDIVPVYLYYPAFSVSVSLGV